MGWREQRFVDRFNSQLANVFASGGQLENTWAYLCPQGEISHFVISGGVCPEDRYGPLYPALEYLMGRVPLVILHGENTPIEDLAAQAWQRRREEPLPSAPLWVCGPASPLFEPFYAMSDMQVITTCRRLAAKLGYTITPRFERVVRAHLSILHELDVPCSLSGLYYLCQFRDMGEFHENVIELPCGQERAMRIWADLGADDESGNSQFDLFRAVINHLAQEAEMCGWNANDTICQCNCITAVCNGAVFLLQVDEANSELVLAYLAEELKMVGGQPFFLLLDDVRAQESGLLDSARAGRGHVGLVSENVVDQIGWEEREFLRFAENVDCFILLKHNTGKTAEILSEVLGRYDHAKVESSSGVTRGFFQLLPQNRHEDVRYSVENRYRVMPEELTRLGPGQAIIFLSATDQIIYYN